MTFILYVAIFATVASALVALVVYLVDKNADRQDKHS
jgi:hypothetical protein